MGTLESTRPVYERILDLKIATPQTILSYALLLEVGEGARGKVEMEKGGGDKWAE